MSEKKSIKRIAIIILIVANIAVIIALASSILKATTKIQIGKEIDTSTGEEVPPDEEMLPGEESTGDEQIAPEDGTAPEEETPTEDEPAAEEETPLEDEPEAEEKEGTLTEILGQLKNQKVSIVEIVLMFVGIGLFIMGAILLKIAKGMR